MKINIKNLLFQPLALHLAAGGEGLHLSARECREVLAEHISVEIQRAAARGLVTLIGKVAGKPEHPPSDDSAASVAESVEKAAKPQSKSRRGRAR